MSWNYRMLRHDDGSVAVYEVYYDEQGHPSGWQTVPAIVLSDDAEGIGGVLDMMRLAIRRPVLAVNGDSLVEVTT